MEIIKSPQAMQKLVESWRKKGGSIGFVPTMGALHRGHLALAEAARENNDRLVASIFVNPLQFAVGEDFDKYNRPFERDCELLEELGCDAVFSPDDAAMYEGDSRTFVEVEALGAHWEGALRPSHFRGVTTVVAKLFNIVKPHRAYFGEKDFQQLRLIEQMVCDLNFDVKIVRQQTIRESDGLALSSRNVYLSEEERAAAPAIYRALLAGQQTALESNDASAVLASMHGVLSRSPVLKLEYVAVVDARTLEPLENINDRDVRLLMAARAGSTRLIDNIAA